MSTPARPIFIATRGSALALAQANIVLAQCQAALPERTFEIKIIKTTGDNLQNASLVDGGNSSLVMGYWRRRVALLRTSAHSAVSSAIETLSSR